MKILRLLIFLLMLVACGRQPVPANALVLINGKVIDGTGKAPITDGVVVMVGEYIYGVGAKRDFSLPEGVRIIDVQGGTILPGIINAHTHSPVEAPGDPRDPWPILDLQRVQVIVDGAHGGGVPVRAHVFEPYLVEEIVLPAGVGIM